MKMRSLKFSLGAGVVLLAVAAATSHAQGVAKFTPLKSVASHVPMEALVLRAVPTVGAAKVLSGFDQTIRFHEQRAVQSKSWSDLEVVARTYLSRAHLSGSYDDYRAAEQSLERAFELAPAGSGPFMLRAHLNFSMHRFDRVEPDLKRAESAVLVAAPVRAAIRDMRADLAMLKGNYEGALKTYQAALDKQRNVATLLRVAQYHWKSGDFKRADSTFAEAASMVRAGDGESIAFVELQRGLMELDRGRYDAALTHYRKADKAFPGWYLIEEHIAEALAKTGKFQDAEARYRALVKKTDNPEFMHALSGVLEARGKHSEASEFRKRAESGYRKELGRYREATAGHALGFFLETRSGGKLALELAELNHELRPGAESQVLLGQARLQAGDCRGALQALESALETPFNTAELHASAALAYGASGLKAQARRERERALKLNPDALADLEWLEPASCKLSESE